jgi:hypothetical protein
VSCRDGTQGSGGRSGLAPAVGECSGAAGHKHRQLLQGARGWWPTIGPILAEHPLGLNDVADVECPRRVHGAPHRGHAHWIGLTSAAPGACGLLVPAGSRIGPAPDRLHTFLRHNRRGVRLSRRFPCGHEHARHPRPRVGRRVDRNTIAASCAATRSRCYFPTVTSGSSSARSNVTTAPNRTSPTVTGSRLGARGRWVPQRSSGGTDTPRAGRQHAHHLLAQPVISPTG